MSNIIFIGGGEIGKGETYVIDSKVMNLAKKGSSFVFFGTAANDADGYIKTMEKIYGDYFDVVSATKERGRQFSEDAIKNASVIYLGGGMTELLMKHFEEWGLVTSLAEAISNDVIVVGMSAGAQALSNHYVHEEGDSMEIRKGWGLSGINACILVHATEENFEKARIIYDKNNLSGELYGIGESAALWLKDNNESPENLGMGKVFRHF